MFVPNEWNDATRLVKRHPFSFFVTLSLYSMCLVRQHLSNCLNRSIFSLLEGQPDNTVVVFQFLDTSLFMARTEEGGLVPAQKGLDGAFHVDGDSVLVPKELQYNTFQLILPILEAVGDRKLIIVTPIPRLGTCSGSLQQH